VGRDNRADVADWIKAGKPKVQKASAT